MVVLLRLASGFILHGGTLEAEALALYGEGQAPEDGSKTWFWWLSFLLFFLGAVMRLKGMMYS